MSTTAPACCGALPVTASLGTTAVRLGETDGDDKPLVDRLVANADWAMYRAKRAGGATASGTRAPTPSAGGRRILMMT
jgi:GGDEF domain-containing protein